MENRILIVVLNKIQTTWYNNEQCFIFQFVYVYETFKVLYTCIINKSVEFSN